MAKTYSEIAEVRDRLLLILTQTPERGYYRITRTEIEETAEVIASLNNPQPASEPQAPIDMVLHCPRCHTQHVDAPDDRSADWINPPHRSHLCHACGCIWRPADVATNGVQSIKTKGKADSEPQAQLCEPIPGYQCDNYFCRPCSCDPPRQARASLTSQPAVDRRDAVPQQFIDYMVRNYLPNTVISDPAWHAPRILRAAVSALRQQSTKEPR